MKRNLALYDLENHKWQRKVKIKPVNWMKEGDYMEWYGKIYKILKIYTKYHLQIKEVGKTHSYTIFDRIEFIDGNPKVFDGIPKIVKLLYEDGVNE